MPQSPAEILAWAAEHGVHDQLRTVFGEVLDEPGERTDCPSWSRRQTVLELLASGQLLPFRPNVLAHLREVAWAFLQREVASVREGIAAEARPPPAPAHPALAALAARLVELREGLRKRGAMPRALARTPEAQLRLDRDARAITTVKKCCQPKQEEARAAGKGAAPSAPAVSADGKGSAAVAGYASSRPGDRVRHMATTAGGTMGSMESRRANASRAHAAQVDSPGIATSLVTGVIYHDGRSTGPNRT